MATTSSYRNPVANDDWDAIDGSVNVTGPERRPSTKRANQARQPRYPVQRAMPSSASEAPRPTTSYRHSYNGVPPHNAEPTMSFSERARNLPPERRLSILDHSESPDSTEWVESQKQWNGGDLARGSSRRERSHTDSQGALQGTPSTQTGSAPQLSQQTSPMSRSNTVRSSRRDEQREWAPERSPLQKLEVTLKDISKEEKRARVEEAEMLLREAKAGRKSRRVTQNRAQSSPSSEKKQRNGTAPEPSNLEEAGLLRSLSGKQKDRLQRSATVESKKPQTQRSPGGGRNGFDYEEQQPAGGYSPPGNKSHAPPNRFEPRVGALPHATHEQLIAKNTKPHNRNWSSDSQGRGAPNGQITPRKPTQFQRFAEPTTTAQDAHTSSVQRSNSRKPQNQYPRGPNAQAQTKQSGEPEDIQFHQRSAIPHHIAPVSNHGQYKSESNAREPTEPEIHVNDEAFGPGLNNSGDQPQRRELPQPGVGNGNSRGKQHTVSFAVPPPTPPPQDEWRTAEVAKLHALDFDLRDFDAGRAWWEGGGSGSRRKRRESRGIVNEEPRLPKIKAKSE